MGKPVAVLKLKYVNEYRDRTDKLRRYFRRGKTRGLLPGEVGSDEFMSAYREFLADRKPAAIPRNAEGSFGRLITEYYGSRPFLNLKPSSRKIYRYVLEPLAKAHGHRMVRDMRTDKVAKIIQDIGESKPGMANLTKSVLQKMMKYAVKMKWRADNPVLGIEPFKRGTHHTWTEGELKTFEVRWPLGTRQRLAYALLLCTAQRVGDVAKMTRADIVDGELHVIQQKTGAELYLPVLPELAQAMKAYPAKGLTLIGTEDGRPLSRAALSHLMRDAIAKAELPAKCVSHGLRKAAMRRLAEEGATEKQIAAVSGHKTLREIERYTAAADQRRLAKDAMGNKKRTRLPNRNGESA
jgi:enterobacteria phage integrase